MKREDRTAMNDKVKEIIDKIAALNLQWEMGRTVSSLSAVREADTSRCPLNVLFWHEAMERQSRGQPMNVTDKSLIDLVKSYGGTEKDAWAIIDAADDQQVIDSVRPQRRPQPEIRKYMLNALRI